MFDCLTWADLAYAIIASLAFGCAVGFMLAVVFEEDVEP